jgi:hypothetical protein
MIDNGAVTKLLEEEFNNRMVLGLYDHSRRIAGDRWVIRLHGEARISLNPDFFNQVPEEDPELLRVVRERLGSELIFTLGRERNFISEEEKGAVMAEMLTRIHENLMTYLKHPSFPEKLFRKQYEEQRKKALLERELSLAAQEEEEEEGPADFSFYFQDKDKSPRS